jgi:hypothetical protein
MTLAALTSTQQAAVDQLVASQKLQTVQADEAKAGRFLDQASEAMAEVPHIGSTNLRYNIAYDAAHDVGEAMLAAYGYRTSRGAGQHVALGEYLQAIFDTPPAREAARRFDQMRGARNGLRYRAFAASEALAMMAVDTTTVLLQEARERLP